MNSGDEVTWRERQQGQPVVLLLPEVFRTSEVSVGSDGVSEIDATVGVATSITLSAKFANCGGPWRSLWRRELS